MEEDYKKGLLPDYLTPYFEWRYGLHRKHTFTLEEAVDMGDKADEKRLWRGQTNYFLFGNSY